MSRHVCNDATPVRLRQAASFRMLVVGGYRRFFDVEERNIHLLGKLMLKWTRLVLTIYFAALVS